MLESVKTKDINTNYKTQNDWMYISPLVMLINNYAILKFDRQSLMHSLALYWPYIYIFKSHSPCFSKNSLPYFTEGHSSHVAGVKVYSTLWKAQNDENIMYKVKIIGHSRNGFFGGKFKDA